MRVTKDRLRPAVLGSVIAAVLMMAACSTGSGTLPQMGDSKQTQGRIQTAAQPSGADLSASPVAVVTEEPWQYGVRIDFGGPIISGGPPKTRPGAQLKLQLKAQPMMYRHSSRGAGLSVQTLTWEQPEIAEMRFCIVTRETTGLAPGAPLATCELLDAWVPYAPTQEVTAEVDWIGPGEVSARVQFRRADGTIVHGISPRYEPIEIASSSSSFDSVLDPSASIAGLPPAVQAAATARRSAFPVNGSVKVQNSPCCVGGTVGESKTVQVTFSASSQHGPVAEMRQGYGGCNTGQLERVDTDWQPFVAQRNETIGLVSGWSSFAVAVQYRDVAGNLSLVQCDSVGVEGMPVRPPGAR